VSRASYVPNLAAYCEARQDARAAIYLFHLRRVPRGRRVYLHNMASVALRTLRAAYGTLADARFLLVAGPHEAARITRSRCGGKEI
jgi:hypothetical protein